MAPRPRNRPLMVYDGDCGFCRRWIARWWLLTRRRVDYAPFQKVAGQFPEIPVEKFQGAVHLIETDGSVFSGAEAAFRVLAYNRARRWLLWAYRRVPGFAPVSEYLYQVVAGHRPFFSRVSALLFPHLSPPTYDVAASIVLRALGGIYLIAFISLWVQVEGLIGGGGILPVKEFLEAVTAQVGPERFRLLPTLCWINAGDSFLHLLCGAGVLLSILLILGMRWAPILLALWALYLSLAVVSREFLWYQWDSLLLEAGFLAIFLGWPTPRPFARFRVSPVVVWLFRWLLFRLVFSSGMVKLLSGDPLWANLTAMAVHYETQPIPNPTSWYIHQMPLAFHKASTVAVLAAELALPFLVFAPGRLRWLGGALLAGFQGIILLTGNYCFFNLLTAALCLFLVEDAGWPRRWRRGKGSIPVKGWPAWVTAALAAVVLLMTVPHVTRLIHPALGPPAPVRRMAVFLEPLRSFNSYGLFAVMTPVRPEIIVEGSRDGKLWLPYEFRYKPVDPNRPPPFIAPHQPRLDWQMWFAALDRVQEVPWFFSLCRRLLEGSPEVRALLRADPFPMAPPRYVRAIAYDYSFTDFAERRATGAWWKRRDRRLYCPPLTLDEKGELIAAPPVALRPEGSSTGREGSASGDPGIP